MPQVSNFEQFSESYIDKYYRTKVLGNKSEQQLELELIMRRAALLHEDLRNYGSLSEQDKPLIVSGILLALCHPVFDTDMLSDPKNDKSDGEIIFEAIQEHLKDLRHDLPTKYDLVLDQFTFIKNRPQLSSMHPALGKSPLKYFAEYIHSKVYAAICNNSPEDVLGRFYGEFLCYSGGDGKGLGIVLTPSHITQLMVDLLQIHTNDRVFDPCCGTGGFLISAMNAMLDETAEVTDTEYKKKQLAARIKKEGLHGIEMNDRMFSIATTNMVLRGDGKSNLICDDFLKIPAEELRKNNYTVGLMNPPYSQAKNKFTAHLSELTFINHLLDSLAEGASCAVIVPQSTMVGKTQSDAEIKKEILKHHTLKGVITLNTKTFYPVATNPVIAIFTAHRKHPKEERCKFIDFQNDGFSVAQNVGLIDNGTFDQKKKKLLDCWFGYVDEKPSSSFIITTAVSAKDEWLHSFYYFNDEIPSAVELKKTMADYLAFEFKMILEGRGYLFKEDLHKWPTYPGEIPSNISWGDFLIGDLFEVKRPNARNKDDYSEGDVFFVASGAENNGVMKCCSPKRGESLDKGNCITVSPVDGSCFYQPVDFLGRGGAGSSILLLYHKDKILNKYSGLYISRMIEQVTTKYSYGHMATSSSIKKDRIFLPVTNLGNPDYAYMEAYMRKMEADLVMKYMDYQQNKK